MQSVDMKRKVRRTRDCVVRCDRFRLKKKEKKEMIISAVVHLSALMCGYETFVQLLEYSRVREIGEERNTEILFVVHLYHDDTPS